MAVDVSGGQTGNFVLSSDGARLFVAGEDGNLRVYDSNSGTLAALWDVGNNLGAVDISPDGTFLLITEQQPVSFTSDSVYWTSNQTSSAVYRVDTATGAVQTFIYNSTGSDYTLADVAITAGGAALFTQNILPGWSGWTPLVQLDLTSGTFSKVNGSNYYQSGSLTAAPDNQTVLEGQLGLSSGQAFILSAAGTVLSNNGIYENNVYGSEPGIEAYSGTGPGGRVAIYTGGRLHLWNGSFQYLSDLTQSHAELASIAGLTFSADGTKLYALSSANRQIYEIRMADLSIVPLLDVGNYNFVVSAWGSELQLSPDGQSFFIQTTSGIERADLPIVSVGTAGDDHFGGVERADQYSGLDGNDAIYGNGGDDILYGNTGNDLIAGGTGADRMIGGIGNDVYFVDSASDVVIENAGEGNDRLVASASFALGSSAEVETMETNSQSGTSSINLTGSETANLIFGNNGDNVLSGMGGDDVIHGYYGNDYIVGGAGLDYLYGGAGNDRFIIDSADGDRVWEFAGEGYDTVGASVDYTLSETSDVERLEAATFSSTTPLSLGGSDTDNLIIGNAGNNVLRGNGGGDVLHGLGGDDVLVGGDGADAMYGEAGNDTYYVESSSDHVYEVAGEGTADRVATTVSFTLPNDSDVEILDAMNLTGTTVGELGGSDTANTISGDAANNVIRGNGGDDALYGNAGNDVLSGDAGNDRMFGGSGDDVYYIDSAADQVTEYVGEGKDRVSTSVSFALSASADVEILEASTFSAATALNFTGSDTANTIIGNNGANVLDGRAGNDRLIGGGGADTFAFTSALGSGNVDRIDDFTVGIDKIGLDHSLFSNIGLGAFSIGNAAKTLDTRIIYDPKTGALLYDDDGSGSHAAIQFATLSQHLLLTSSDFLII